MKNSVKKGFTLVELLVVITILSIISVVAYQSFSGATSSAVSARKLSDVTTIESSLQQYKITNNFYPKVDLLDTTTSKWGYDPSTSASRSNLLSTTKNGDQITAIATASGGGKVLGKDTYASQQVGAKGVISQQTLGKQFLTKDLYDPELGDVKVGSGKMVDEGVGRYVYAVYAKPVGSETEWTTSDKNKQGTYYNIAYTVKKEDSDEYITVITGDYDKESCFDKKDSCPDTLIGSGETVLTDKLVQSASGTTVENQGIPYPLANY